MIRVFLKDIDITSWVNLPSIVMTDSSRIKADTCTLEIHYQTGESVHPLAGNPIEIRYYPPQGLIPYFFPYPIPSPPLPSWAVGRRSAYKFESWEWCWDAKTNQAYVLEFAGLVKRIRKRWISPPDYFVIECYAEDWTSLLDRYLVTRVIRTGEMLSKVLETLLLEKGDGLFTLRYWPAADKKLLKTEFKDRRLSEIFSELLEPAGLFWFIDAKRTVHVLEDWRWLAPKSWIEPRVPDLAWGNLEIEENIGEIKNRIKVEGVNLPGREIEIVGTEEGRTIFYLARAPFPTDRLELIHKYMEVRVVDRVTGQPKYRGEKLELLRDMIDGSPGDRKGTINQAFVNFDAWYVRLPDLYPLRFDEKIIIRFREAVPAPQILHDTFSIRQVKERESCPALRIYSSGVYEDVLTLEKVFSDDGREIAAYLDRYFARHGYPIISGSFISYLPGWRALQRLDIEHTPILPIEVKSPPPPHISCWIHEVRKRVMAPDKILSEITFSNRAFEV